MKKESICCVIVTFNRLELLKEALRGIFKQTIEVDKIIIVDNNSTDGTREWLKSIESNLIQIVFQENSGGAGGFFTGVKLAYDQDYDWIWMMDDDVEAKSNCLEELIKYKDISKCIHPRKIFLDNVDHYWEHYYNYSSGLIFGSKNDSFKNGKDICFLNVGNFEGMLISRIVVEKIGFPNKDYFIAGDDTEYGFLANQYTNVSYVKNAIIIRKKKSTEELETLFYKYYMLRNRHISRNLIFKINGNKSTFIFDLTTYFIFFTEIINSFKIKGGSNKIKKIKILFKAFLDYKLKKVGKTF